MRTFRVLRGRPWCYSTRPCWAWSTELRAWYAPRRMRVRLWALCASWSVAFATLAALSASAESAEPGEQPFGGGEQWVPSFAITSGIVGQQREARVESACERGGPPNPAIGSVACWESESEHDRSRCAPLTAATTSPSIVRRWRARADDTGPVAPLPGQPELVPARRTDPVLPRRARRREGRRSQRGRLPTPVDRPTAASANNTFPSAALNGTGSEVQSEMQRFGYGAGVGLAFPFRYRERWLWVKPSANWVRFGLDVEGRVTGRHQGRSESSDGRRVRRERPRHPARSRSRARPTTRSAAASRSRWRRRATARSARRSS
jgi:hypothetical protein